MLLALCGLPLRPPRKGEVWLESVSDFRTKDILDLLIVGKKKEIKYGLGAFVTCLMAGPGLSDYAVLYNLAGPPRPFVDPPRILYDTI